LGAIKAFKDPAWRWAFQFSSYKSVVRRAACWREQWVETSECMKSSGAMDQIDALVFITVVRFGNVTERYIPFLGHQSSERKS
jgi:hypothetical protein